MDTTKPMRQYLTFVVGAEQYGVDVERVREIVECVPITEVPATPAAILGVVNLRGSVVPVIDPGVRFGIERRPITKWSCIVFVEIDAAGMTFVMGLLVDSISEVLELPADAIEPVPPFGTEIPLEFLQGMGAIGAKFFHLLDLDRVLSLSDLAVAASLTPPSAAGWDVKAEGTAST